MSSSKECNSYYVPSGKTVLLVGSSLKGAWILRVLKSVHVHPRTHDRVSKPGNKARVSKGPTWALDVHEIGVGALHKSL